MKEQLYGKNMIQTRTLKKLHAKLQTPSRGKGLGSGGGARLIP